MKRPIAQEAADRKAVMWRKDEWGEAWETTDFSKALHRHAGQHYRLSCIPRRSAIDGRYYAEINRYRGQGVSDFNIALGRGDNPVEAALAGYQAVVGTTPFFQVIGWEIEIERWKRQLARDAANAIKVERLISTIEKLLAALKPEPTVAELAAANTEDDDL